MRHRLIFVECTPSFWIDAARRVVDGGDAEVVHWVGSPAMEAEIRAEFPDASFQGSLEAVRGVAIRGAAESDGPALSRSLLEALSLCEAGALAMMDRMCLEHGDFPYPDRVRHYHRLVRHGLALLERTQPDLVVFSIAPHQIHDFVLYHLCRIRNVPTLMFERIGIPGRLVALERFEDGLPDLAAEYRRLRDADVVPALSPAAEALLVRTAGHGPAAMPANFEKKLKRLGLYGSSSGPIGGAALRLWLKNFVWDALHLLRNRRWATPPFKYLKRSRSAPEDAPIGHFELRIRQLKSVLAKRRLYRRYMALQKIPDLSAPYIFVALHYQPERNTSPLAGAFVNQQLIVDLLCRAVPAGWRIYVKEHGWQLSLGSNGAAARSPNYYDDLVKQPTVSLVPIEMQASTLIANAKAVATVAGSVGWEALVKGAPALVFGPAWYRDCAGAFPISSETDVCDALAAIRSDSHSGNRQVRLFLAAAERVSFSGLLEPNIEETDGVTAAETANGLAAAILGRIGPAAKTPARAT
jgi:hypothetical protein